jgi:predicted dehydrogenase
MSGFSRREFLSRASALGAAGLLALHPKRPVLGANDRIGVGIVGLRGQGTVHIQGFHKLDGVEVVALCDVDEEVLEARATAFEKATGKKVKRYVDMRQLFEDKEADCVSFATPNHWHALGAIWAMQAGKDVYVEKPCSHNVWEGRQLVLCARRYDRICQHGTQSRSSRAVREAIQKLREGIIGEVYMAKGLCYKWRGSIGRVDGPQQPPKSVHYDLWLGPAPFKLPMRRSFHYDWHWFWDYGNGDIGNQGVHQMDVARWGLGVGLPSVIHSSGGKFLFDDDKETPNCQIAVFQYPKENKILQFEVRHWITNHEGGFGKGADNEIGVIFYGSEGYMVVGGSDYRTFLGRKQEPGPSASGGGNHFANFIEAVRSRNRELLLAEIEEGHLSSALCHLANVAYCVGRTIRFDPATETCPGDDEANKLLTRDYRKPYVVPSFA